MPNIDADSIIGHLEGLHGRPLEESERDEIYLWTKGRALSQVVSLYGWDVMKEMLDDYVIGADVALRRTDPSIHTEVLANHAVLYSVNSLVEKFKQDVERFVGMKMPDILKRGVAEASQALTPEPLPPE